MAIPFRGFSPPPYQLSRQTRFLDLSQMADQALEGFQAGRGIKNENEAGKLAEEWITSGMGTERPGSGFLGGMADVGAPAAPPTRRAGEFADTRPASNVRDGEVAPRQTASAFSGKPSDAVAYLVSTASPGGTMRTQGPEVALGRLHPTFAERLASAIQEARAKGINAGVFSAYRPPGLGVGGFRNKADSLHAYGGAVDVTGIGRPGSATARQWYVIARKYGLENPYGPDHPKEWNHFQLTADRVAPQRVRGTINDRGPVDQEAMWNALMPYQTASASPREGEVAGGSVQGGGEGGIRAPFVQRDEGPGSPRTIPEMIRRLPPGGQTDQLRDRYLNPPPSMDRGRFDAAGPRPPNMDQGRFNAANLPDDGLITSVTPQQFVTILDTIRIPLGEPGGRQFTDPNAPVAAREVPPAMAEEAPFQAAEARAVPPTMAREAPTIANVDPGRFADAFAAAEAPVAREAVGGGAARGVAPVVAPEQNPAFLAHLAGGGQDVIGSDVPPAPRPRPQIAPDAAQIASEAPQSPAEAPGGGVGQTATGAPVAPSPAALGGQPVPGRYSPQQIAILARMARNPLTRDFALKIAAQHMAPDDFQYFEVNGQIVAVNKRTGQAAPIFGEPAAAEREIRNDAQGVPRYVDTGETVFPDDQPKGPTPTDDMREYEYDMQQRETLGQPRIPFGQWMQEQRKAGATSVTVGGESSADDKLRGELSKAEGERWSAIQEQGAVAADLNQGLAIMEELAGVAPGGPLTGRLAQMFPGFSDAGDAFRAAAERMAPQMRVPGSGSTSDVEFEGMRRAIPGLINREEGKRAIISIMRAKNEIDIQRSDVINRYLNEEIDAPTARRELAALNRVSIIPPELRSLLGIESFGPEPGASVSDDGNTVTFEDGATVTFEGD